MLPGKRGNEREFLERARRIRLVAFDVDGVLTEGKVTYTSTGEEMKSFDIKDGHAIKMGRRAGLTVAFITGRTSPIVDLRAKELGVVYVFQGAREKKDVLQDILSSTDFKAEEIAFLGDDVVDLPVMTRVGLGCAVADAVPEVLDAADLVTDAIGGRGAARELIVYLLKAQGKWDDLMSKYK